MIQQLTMAFIGTIAFSLLFGVPTKFYPWCGLIGAFGWMVYLLLGRICSETEATFLATMSVIFLSRLVAVRQKCPATVFLISGIFPLVPGSGIYWTAYYLVINRPELAVEKGFLSVKLALAIVLGIVFVFEIPQHFFQLAAGKKRK